MEGTDPFFLKRELGDDRGSTGEALAAASGTEREARDGGAPYFLGRPRFRFADSVAIMAAAAGGVEEGSALTAWVMANEFASAAAEENGTGKISLRAVPIEAAPSMT